MHPSTNLVRLSMRRSTAAYLYDIHIACEKIRTFIRDKTFEGYTRDSMLSSAVERQFEIIGEALNQLLKVAPDYSESISDPERIISFRNRLIHGYATVSDKLVWAIIEKNLPILEKEVGELLSR